MPAPVGGVVAAEAHPQVVVVHHEQAGDVGHGAERTGAPPVQPVGPRPPMGEDGQLLAARVPRDRMRDFLVANGPARPAEVAAACGVPLADVMAEIDRGALEPSGAREPSGPCAVCGGPARVNALCGRCRATLSV